MRGTPEQRAAIADREGSSLLAAAAGSGKTAVMVERFAEAVLEDGVAVGAIVTLTFTEKAAAELRERIRRRFAELGEMEHVRAVDAAWIGTIHGFCARVLRSRPLAAGLDPRFGVLDEAAQRRLAAEAFEAALEAWIARRGGPAVDLAAAYGRELEPMVTGA
ncbi:MAG: UvrD-helicase domain-containing protein, partial [Solirubrobacteraceae bacterium]